MRSRTFSIVATAGLLALVLAVGSAMAQTRVALRADIPFEFMAGKATLPAGEYSVEFPPIPSTVALGNADRSAQVMVLTNAQESTAPSGHSKLVFRKYGDRYFLAEIWTEGTTRGYQLPVTKTERELTRTAAALQTVAILAQR